jgi:hypothetical protein
LCIILFFSEAKSCERWKRGGEREFREFESYQEIIIIGDIPSVSMSINWGIKESAAGQLAGNRLLFL